MIPRFTRCNRCDGGLVEVAGMSGYVLRTLRVRCPTCDGLETVDEFDPRVHCGACAEEGALELRAPGNESCQTCLDEAAFDVDAALSAVGQSAVMFFVTIGMLMAMAWEPG